MRRSIHRLNGIGIAGSFVVARKAMLTAKAANFDGRYCLAAFIDVVYPLNAWAAHRRYALG
jgi:hypothetical protein